MYFYLGTFEQNKENTSTNLFAMAVGIKQKDLVNKMVKKVISRGVLYKLFITNVLFWYVISADSFYPKLQFLVSNFVVMLFHYDGIVDEWNDFEWNNQVIHVAVANQSKW